MHKYCLALVHGSDSKMLITLFCLLSFVQLSYLSSPQVVTTSKGQVRGKWLFTRGGRKIEGYLGIPYAAPPVGELRFQSPQPPSPWETVLNATTDTPGCIQNVDPPYVPLRPTTASEDCLYLNVFTPNTSLSLPVLVFVYGGSFETGSGSSSAYGPDYLLDEDIVLVTFTYRGGILGFLSLEDPVLPGNMGLKDQREVFRWVHDNIYNFGGDPTKVTIFGQSAGAASVHFHLVSTVKEGLFRAAIADSGSARSFFSWQPPGSNRPLIARLANLTQCPTDSKRLVACLQQVPATDFVTLNNKLRKTDLSVKSHTPVFTPMIEPDCVQDAVIRQDIFHTTISTPLLQGANQYEGLFRSVDIEKDTTDKNFEELNQNYREVIPYNLFLENRVENPERLGELLKSFYFGNETIDRTHYLKYVNLISDGFYNFGLVLSTRANYNKTYFYRMNYKGSNSIVHYLGSKAYYGVSHVDELFYLFPCGGPGERNITLSDTRFSRKLVKMWTNFVKYLDPTPNGVPTEWQPVSTQGIEYLDIGQHSFCMKNNFLKKRMDFWNSIQFKDRAEQEILHCTSSSSAINVGK